MSDYLRPPSRQNKASLSSVKAGLIDKNRPAYQPASFCYGVVPLLVGVGFIDNTGDNQLFGKREEIVGAIASEILGQPGIKYLASPSPPSCPPTPNQQTSQVLYRVMAGPYAVGENAEKQVGRLKGAAFMPPL